MKRSTRLLALMLSMLFVLLLASGCGGGTSGSEATSQASAATGEPAQNDTPASDDVVTITVFSPNVDRSSERGLVEEMLANEYMAEHPNVRIVSETLENESYKPKLKAYIASNSLPDIFYIWDQPTWLDPVVEAGQVEPLDPAYLTDQDFTEASWDGVMYGEECYGLPNQSEFYIMYYNKEIFADNNLEIPTSFEDLLAVSKTLRDNGIQPCAMSGKEQWLGNNLIWNMMIQLDPEGFPESREITANRTGRYADYAPFVDAQSRFMELVDAGFFHDNWLNADNSEMYNMFASAQTAMMYFAGSYGFITSNLPEGMEDKVGTFLFPASANDPGDNGDMCAQYVTCYSIAKGAPQEAFDYLYWMMEKEHYTKYCWDHAGQLTAQDVAEYVSDADKAGLKGDILDMSNSVNIAGGLIWSETLNSTFVSAYTDLLSTMWSGMIGVDDMIAQLDTVADECYEEIQNG